MVHPSKFAEFHQEMFGNTFNIASPLEINNKFRIITCKCNPDKGHFISILSRPSFSAPLAFVRLEPWFRINRINRIFRIFRIFRINRLFQIFRIIFWIFRNQWGVMTKTPAFLYFFQPKAYMQLPKMLSPKALNYFVGNYIWPLGM